MTFHERKAERKERFERFVKGWKQRKCVACNGSGRYDSNGSPPCASCNGTGVETYDPTKECCHKTVQKRCDGCPHGEGL